MYYYDHQLRVRYAETDQMKYVYYGNYALYFEVARVEYLRSLGFAYKDLEEKYQTMMPVLENFSKYHWPAYYDDLLTIRVRVPQLPSVKIKFEYEIFNEDQKLLHSGWTLLAFLHTQTHRPVRCPEVLLNLLHDRIAI